MCLDWLVWYLPIDESIDSLVKHCSLSSDVFIECIEIDQRRLNALELPHKVCALDRIHDL
jgi:hypothetical protein